MEKRYLMRLGKSPLESVNGFDSFDRNTIGGNSGNLVFGAASHKLFSTEGTTVDANHYVINRRLADKVNDEYDGFILPLANAFRPSFEPELRRTAEFIERLKVPFLMLSGGAQLPMDGDPEQLKGIESTVKRFASAVLDKSSTLTVRGELSAQYLKSLGFDDVVVVGCPSMTMNGRGHSVKVPEALPQGSRIAYNVETSNPFGGDLIEDAEQKYDTTYIAQDKSTLEMMLWGTAPRIAEDTRIPLEKSHSQFVNGAAEYHLDASSWIKSLSRKDFSFGARIHGNIAAILAGTPAVVLAHDGRTFELARYHGIPALDVETQYCPKTVQELYELADFTEFNRGHTERFERLSDFIHENGFAHIYDAGQEDARMRYEQAVHSTEFPPPQKPVWLGQPPEVQHMMSALQRRYAQLTKTDKSMDNRISKLKRRTDTQTEELRERIDLTTKHLESSRRSTLRRFLDRIR